MSGKARSREAVPKRAKSAKRPKCPICGKPATQDYRPFCGKACADEDLRRWLGGRYVVPGEAVGQKGDEDEN
ncbi:MAG TPA: DNA gyrase inhibitor YacG [Methyloceanibacter sp.]|nr:DNA gyrase inhibitor YacG [Methyloceanibacter sp.]